MRAAAQVETGSAITWKYPSVVLRGDNSVGEFYSVALTNNHQQARSFALHACCWGPVNELLRDYGASAALLLRRA